MVHLTYAENISTDINVNICYQWVMACSDKTYKIASTLYGMYPKLSIPHSKMELLGHSDKFYEWGQPWKPNTQTQFCSLSWPSQGWGNHIGKYKVFSMIFKTVEQHKTFVNEWGSFFTWLKIQVTDFRMIFFPLVIGMTHILNGFFFLWTKHAEAIRQLIA